MRLLATAAATMLLALAALPAAAKLPALNDEAKAKAAEAAAKTAHGNKVADYKLCLSQDKVAAKYVADAKAAGKAVTPSTTPACADPGPFAYTPSPPAKPIEAAGAHSPPETAAKPPSTTAPAAATTPTPKPKQ